MRPEDRFYLESHEWAKLDGDTISVGITDFAIEQLGEAGSGGFEAEFADHTALGPPQVATDHRLAAPLLEHPDGRQYPADPGVVGDLSIGERYVEVDTKENLRTVQIEVANRGSHGRPRAHADLASSIMRTENPHSLSYQLSILAM